MWQSPSPQPPDKVGMRHTFYLNRGRLDKSAFFRKIQKACLGPTTHFLSRNVVFVHAVPFLCFPFSFVLLLQFCFGPCLNLTHHMVSDRKCSYICFSSYLLCEKRNAENRYVKGARPSGSRHTMILSRGSLTVPLACALLEQETTVRAQIPGIVARIRFFWKPGRGGKKRTDENWGLSIPIPPKLINGQVNWWASSY